MNIASDSMESKATLVQLLKDLRPKHGTVGSRDVDVTAQQGRIDAAIAMLAGAAPVEGAQPPGADLHEVTLEEALADTDRVPYLIVFDDQDQKDEQVIGRARARFRFKQISGSWNAHLFVKIASNSRDEPYPSAAASTAASAWPPCNRECMCQCPECRTEGTVNTASGVVITVGPGTGVCQFPTCESEAEQNAIAGQVHSELYGAPSRSGAQS